MGFLYISKFTFYVLILEACEATPPRRNPHLSGWDKSSYQINMPEDTTSEHKCLDFKEDVVNDSQETPLSSPQNIRKTPPYAAYSESSFPAISRVQAPYQNLTNHVPCNQESINIEEEMILPTFMMNPKYTDSLMLENEYPEGRESRLSDTFLGLQEENFSFDHPSLKWCQMMVCQPGNY